MRLLKYKLSIPHDHLKIVFEKHTHSMRKHELTVDPIIITLKYTIVFTLFFNTFRFHVFFSVVKNFHDLVRLHFRLPCISRLKNTKSSHHEDIVTAYEA